MCVFEMPTPDAIAVCDVPVSVRYDERFFMLQSLHSANKIARARVCSVQFAKAPAPCENVAMKLRLKDLRKRREWTLDHVSELSGTSKGYLSQLETGKCQPSAAMLETLADVFEVQIPDLIDKGDLAAKIVC